MSVVWVVGVEKFSSVIESWPESDILLLNTHLALISALLCSVNMNQHKLWILFLHSVIDRSWSLTFALSSSWMMSSCHLLDWCSWSCTEHSLLTWSPAPVSCDPRPWSPLTPAHKSLMESVLSQLVSGYTVNTPASVSLSTHQNIAHTQTFPSVSSDQRRTLQ